MTKRNGVVQEGIDPSPGFEHVDKEAINRACDAFCRRWGLKSGGGGFRSMINAHASAGMAAKARRRKAAGEQTELQN